MIRVIYKNGDEDLVPPKFLDILLLFDEVEKFQRSGDWVMVTEGNLRRQPQNSSYAGKERRRYTASVLQPFTMENQPYQSSD